jgi:hypothetical protein
VRDSRWLELTSVDTAAAPAAARLKLGGGDKDGPPRFHQLLLLRDCLAFCFFFWHENFICQEMK